MAVRCGLLPLLLALGVYSTVAAPIMQTSEVEEDNAELLAKLNADLDALIETGETLETAQVVSATPAPAAAPPPSPAEERRMDMGKEAVEKKRKYGHVHHNEEPMASLTAIPGYEASEKEKKEANDPDPFKQAGTFTKELRAHERNMRKDPKREMSLNVFKSTNAKKARAMLIAKRIHKLIHGEPETPTQTTVRLIRQKGEKDAEFLHRIVKANKIEAADDEKKASQRKKQGQKEKQNPKSAFTLKIEEKLNKEDKKFVTSNNTQPAPWALAKVNEEGGPSAPPLVKVKDVNGNDQYRHPKRDAK